MADGVYSIFGDLAPMAELQGLLEKYENFHLYIDDAHGMSWTGTHGRGYALDVLQHARLYLATSLNKAFAAGGGIVAFPNEELRRKTRTVGSSVTFAGPLQPANLGAALASAKLHASGALLPLQQGLQDRILYWNQLCKEKGLPLISYAATPIRFIGTGSPKAAYLLMERIMAEGLYPTLTVFPIVPMKQAGIRFTITMHHTLEDIRRAVEVVADHLPRVLEAENIAMDEVWQAFNQSPPCSASPSPQTAVQVVPHAPTRTLHLQVATSIAELDTAEWDALLASRGTFSSEGLLLLEKTFKGHAEPESNWDFRYYVIRDDVGRVVLATFFTFALGKAGV